MIHSIMGIYEMIQKICAGDDNQIRVTLRILKVGINSFLA